MDTQAITGRFHLEIVTHCYRYRRLLAYQISSLRLFPPRDIDVTFNVWYTSKTDPVTAEWLRQPASNGDGDCSFMALAPNIRFRRRDVPPTECYNRAIGRNCSCQETTADYVWLTDCDYLFREGCLDALPHALAAAGNPVLAFPRHAHESISQDSGDEYLSRLSSTGAPKTVDIHPLHFRPMRRSMPIGGLFIYRGDVARERGYISDRTKWLVPNNRWRRELSDRIFRSWLGVRAVPVELPNLYRIRHSQRGSFQRDVEL